MGIFKRAKDIFTANVNSMLDKAEDPEAMINQIVRELEVAISDMKCSCANKLADKKSLERRNLELQKTIIGWIDRSELAVKSGKDDLAKEALKEKIIVQDKKNGIEKELGLIDSDIDLCRDQVGKLEEKLVEIINRRKELLERSSRAEERNYANNIVNKAGGSEILERFSRFESKIERMESEAEIFESTKHSEFEKMEQEQELDKELEALKAKLKTNK